MCERHKRIVATHHLFDVRLLQGFPYLGVRVLIPRIQIGPVGRLNTKGAIFRNWVKKKHDGSSYQDERFSILLTPVLRPTKVNSQPEEGGSESQSDC